MAGVSLFGRLLLALRRHFGAIGSTGDAARSQLFSLNVFFGTFGLDPIWLARLTHGNPPIGFARSCRLMRKIEVCSDARDSCVDQPNLAFAPGRESGTGIERRLVPKESHIDVFDHTPLLGCGNFFRTRISRARSSYGRR